MSVSGKKPPGSQEVTPGSQPLCSDTLSPPHGGLIRWCVCVRVLLKKQIRPYVLSQSIVNKAVVTTSVDVTAAAVVNHLSDGLSVSRVSSRRRVQNVWTF